MSESCFNCKRNTKFDQKTVSLLCVKTKSGAHEQLTFYFQIWKYFCRHLNSSLISMVGTLASIKIQHSRTFGLHMHALTVPHSFSQSECVIIILIQLLFPCVCIIAKVNMTFKLPSVATLTYFKIDPKSVNFVGKFTSKISEDLAMIPSCSLSKLDRLTFIKFIKCQCQV